MNEPVIYTIGDSHAWHTWLKIPGVVTNPQGPMLMYTIGLPENQRNWAKDIPIEAIVCFCWGEIDCRCHVYKYQPWQDCIDRLVEGYLKTVSCSKETHKNIWIYNVLPPPRRNGAVESPGFPFLGSDDDRLAYVKYMNKKLSESEFTFVDVYDKYSDKDGFLKMEISDAHVHIEDEKPLLEWVNLHRSCGL
ncbi:MAG: hypothetical protein WC318_06980 [Candidatus Omnitrophota bacterium]|jgi:hypothetical protein